MSAAVALFLTGGSLAMLHALETHFVNSEQESFRNLARTNGEFLTRNRLPQSPRMAAQLGEIIGARVLFLHPASHTTIGATGSLPEPGALPGETGRLTVRTDGSWAVLWPGNDGWQTLFLKDPGGTAPAWKRPETRWLLGLFWMLSLSLAIGLSLHIARPLRKLADSLPLVGSETEWPALPLSRKDEIGQLARTLDATHHSLVSEREKRRTAERQALLGRMAASLAHEIRNPVSAIRLHAQLLEHAPPAESGPSRRLIESEAERIEDLVSQWMGYANPAPPKRSATHLAGALRQAIDLLSPQAAHAKVALDFRETPTPDSPTVLADRQRLQQVLVNLLRNAIQASPPGSTITIRTESSEPWLSAIIEDEGPGFPPEWLSRLGEPFLSGKEGGMGLGIAVARAICEAHGGSLTAENNPQGGARVRVTLASCPAECEASFPPRHP
jgi:signal transduction histidine kinase